MVANVAGDELADEVGRALDQGKPEDGGAWVTRVEFLLGMALLDVSIFVSNHVDEAVLRIGVHEVGGA